MINHIFPYNGLVIFSTWALYCILCSNTNISIFNQLNPSIFNEYMTDYSRMLSPPMLPSQTHTPHHVCYIKSRMLHMLWHKHDTHNGDGGRFSPLANSMEISELSLSHCNNMLFLSVLFYNMATCILHWYGNYLLLHCGVQQCPECICYIHTGEHSLFCWRGSINMIKRSGMCT